MFYPYWINILYTIFYNFSNFKLDTFFYCTTNCAICVTKHIIGLEPTTYSIFAVCVYGPRTRNRTQNLALIWRQTEHKSVALPIELYGGVVGPLRLERRTARL